MPVYKIKDAAGLVVNTITASHAFVSASHAFFELIPEVDLPVKMRGITKDEFRKRFATTTLMLLDKLEVQLENDAKFDSLCPNVTPATRELYRDGMRTAFKNLYSDDLIHLEHPIAITGVTLFSDAGVITEAEKNTVLDTSTL